MGLFAWLLGGAAWPSHPYPSQASDFSRVVLRWLTAGVLSGKAATKQALYMSGLDGMDDRCTSIPPCIAVAGDGAEAVKADRPAVVVAWVESKAVVVLARQLSKNQSPCEWLRNGRRAARARVSQRVLRRSPAGAERWRAWTVAERGGSALAWFRARASVDRDPAHEQWPALGAAAGHWQGRAGGRMAARPTWHAGMHGTARVRPPWCPRGRFMLVTRTQRGPRAHVMTTRASTEIDDGDGQAS
jgi:hypothetical protein